MTKVIYLPPIERLKPFTKSPKCPKCGNRSILVRFVNERYMGLPAEIPDKPIKEVTAWPEHLECDCGYCKHKWDMRTMQQEEELK